MEEVSSIPLLTKRPSSVEARELLHRRPTGVIGQVAVRKLDNKVVSNAEIRGVFFAWTPAYCVWWMITVVSAIVTVFFVPYQIAFQKEVGSFEEPADYVEFSLNTIFWIDILVNFNLGFYKNEILIFERKEIAKEYLRRMFWVDFIGVFPFETLSRLCAGRRGETDPLALFFSLLRLVRFVRLHRIKKLSHILQYDARISLLWFTLIRNFGVVLVSTHIEACIMYFLARLRSFDETTWLGPLVENMTGFQRYVIALYWSIVTFCTVGYGDFEPSNAVEQIWGSMFMLVNVVIAAWIIGSITLLIVKGDERTGQYRDTLQTLQEYGEMNQFDEGFMAKLKTQLRLEFNNREISDEQVLKHFPSAVRRKVLRKLYLRPLIKTKLMRGVRQKFVDAFLASCKVEIYSPGEEIVERGSILSDLSLLVEGVAEVTTPEFSKTTRTRRPVRTDSFHEDEIDADEHLGRTQLEAGEFIGDIGFFTESPQIDSVSSLTICKTLTISQANYKLLAQDHPGSVGKILENLCAKVEEMKLSLPKDLPVLRAGSVFDIEEAMETSMNYESIGPGGEYEVHERREAWTMVKDLVTMHMEKQLDDQTTRLLFAASRGDTGTISLMCDQGFNPNNADYDSRTALMVAAMKGNREVVELLLQYKADPNLIDMHGSTALLEAVKSGNEKTMELLLAHGAKLCMPESLAASILCQAVFDGDMVLLRRLLQAGIQVDAADYDKRTAAHIAAAESNAAAIRILSSFGADLTLKDRWNNSVQNEAKRSRVSIKRELVRSHHGKS